MSSEAPQSAPAKCRACNRPMNSPLFCGNCRALHPAEGFDYFELLGFAPRYDLDLAALRRRYLQCSRDIHPDHHSGASEAAALSLRTSARLNEAYRVLNDPLLRAEYLLELAGGPSAAEDKSVPPEVLTRTLLARENLAEARAAGAPAALAALRAEVEALYADALAAVAVLARELPGDAGQRAALRQKLNTVKYYQRVAEQC